VIEYRTFRNSDPPGLVRVWSQSFTGRGTAPLRGTTLIEYCAFAKPYFDPKGLVVATEDGDLVGFAHAGFGPNAEGTGLDHSTGVLCALGVLPGHRGSGVGSELLRRAEDYLRARGASTLLAGPMSPRNPFTFALYGGGDSPGFLDSDAAAGPFLQRHGYRLRDTILVLQRPLAEALTVADYRFVLHRQQYEIHARPLPASSWWRECVLGPVEAVEYRLVERGGGPVSRAVLWEMETFRRQQDEHAVGVLALEVEPARRRGGLGKFLSAQILRHLQDQYFNVVEMQVAQTNVAALELARVLGFRQVDAGRCYEKGPAGPPSAAPAGG
jgi:ribosomal protein S18 acetylase RimI-like enzyme